MSLRHESALAWADDLSAAAEPRLGILEAYALQRHPAALEHMGDDGAGLARVAGAKGSGMAGLWLLLPLLLAVVAPVIGFAALLGDPLGYHRLDGDASVPIAGLCFAVAAIVQVVAAVRWLRGPRPRDRQLLLLGLGTAVFAALSWWVMGSAASLASVAGAGGWRAAVLVAGALGLVLAALVLALGRGDATAAAPHGAPADRDALAAALAAVPDDELRRIRDDRDAAIALLAERGRLAPEIADRARRAELGTLHRIDAELRAQ
ncbi:hypothetical protein [Agrococcus sp. TF02-05]|uniref:hypothetical protein n=1 Tax=Agrococcus sp. TF02-05 TaxID=2815211 RepID=UPI001AA1534C|nr:hypothetical protein [Agrococcus sp. TF02-05]MBO1769778.1 hypothetical protein [Agrococcus sp. TF02-05]